VAPGPPPRRYHPARPADDNPPPVPPAPAPRARLLAETGRAFELEQHLHHTAKLAVAGKLASALAHEVGTPLNVIGGRAEVALKLLPAESPAREDLEVIAGQIDRITRILNSLLDTVRPQAPLARPCELAAVIDPLLPLFRHAARARSITFASTVAADLPPVHGDPGQLQQVLTNLIMNALEATPGQGRVSIAVTCATCGRAGVVIEVVDTGSGIPEETIAHVFDPFFTTKPRGQGTGLGLAISRDIVVAHGGDIRIESTVGHGTTVTVWLPETPPA
jgi:signal transduction histidine kinase